MGLLNYTTSISVEKTIGEIQQMLARSKAQAILTEYDGAGNILALSFRIETQCGQLAFKLPADPQPVAQVLNNQAREGKIARRFLNDIPQARRVAWRIIKDWIEAQLAIVETRMVTIEQVFLPYAQDLNGQTIYDKFVTQRFSGLALPAPSEQ